MTAFRIAELISPLLTDIDGKEARIKLAAKLIEACEKEDTLYTNEENKGVQSDSEALTEA